jgi:hypothetical protein
MRFGERLLFFYITDLYEYDLSLPYFDDRVINSLTDIIVVAQDIIDIIALLDLALTVVLLLKYNCLTTAGDSL